MLLLDGQPGLLEPVQDQRSRARRKLRLESLGSTAAVGSAKVLIHDLSPTGILIEADAQLAVGDGIQVELPYGGAWEALVVWSSDSLFGCQFETPIPQAAISAALLKAPPGAATADADERLRDDGLYSFEPSSEPDPDRLPSRTRALVIVGLGLLAWSPIALGVALLLS